MPGGYGLDRDGAGRDELRTDLAEVARESFWQSRRPERPPRDDRDRAYWLERFTLEEIRELGEAIWR
jgi:hypothetical protein